MIGTAETREKLGKERRVVKEQEMEVEPDGWETEEERWRGSVYKRSDAAQSVLVMTQLALHIATNHSPPCPLPPPFFLSHSHSLTLLKLLI